MFQGFLNRYLPTQLLRKMTDNRNKTMAPIRELPIVLKGEGHQPIQQEDYDLNHSQGLSCDELERIPLGALSYYLHMGLKDKNFPEDLASDHLIQLSAHKLSRLLPELDGHFRHRLFEKIYNEDPGKALDILVTSKEPGWEEPSVENPSLYTPPNECAPLPIISEFPREKTMVIPMRGYAISDPYNQPYIATFDVASCIVCTLYDPSTGVGVMTHFDSNSSIDDFFDIILQDLREAGIDLQDIQARIIGVNIDFESSQRTVMTIKNRLTSEGIPIIMEHFLAKNPPQTSIENPFHAFVFDVSSGEVYDYFGRYTEPQYIVKIPGFFAGSPLERHPLSTALSLNR